MLNSPSQVSLPINFAKTPKNERHVHIEGTLRMEVVEQIAKKNNKQEQFTQKKKDLFVFKAGEFIPFLIAYDEVSEFIEDAEDVKTMVLDYLQRCHQEGVTDVEMTCSFDHAKKIRRKIQEEQVEAVGADSQQSENLTYREYVDALAEAIQEAKQRYQIDARVIMVLLRHNPVEQAYALLQDMEKYPHPYVVGIGMAGDEVKYPASIFKTCFEWAKRIGLHTTCHVGEFTSPQLVWDAINTLPLDRLGHANAAAKDPALMLEIANRGISIETCPTSNLVLKVASSIKDHPFRVFRQHNIPVSISSDDPTFFGHNVHEHQFSPEEFSPTADGSTVGAEWDKLQKLYGYSVAEMVEIYRESNRTSFAEESLRNQCNAHANLYLAFVQLKAALEPFRNNSIYTFLLSYESHPSSDNLKTFLSELKKYDEVVDSSLLEKASALDTAHDEYELYRVCYEIDLQDRLQQFDRKYCVKHQEPVIQQRRASYL